MNKIKSVFQKGKAFIPFLTAGDPNLATTEELITGLAEAGADLIEIGIPFSDPIAEGPVIEAADLRALQAGTTIDEIFAMVQKVRQSCAVPLAFMTYINPIFVYGKETFFKKSAECGIDGIIVPDLPFEEKEELEPYCQKYGITLISFIAPTSANRIAAITREAEGFVYCVSSLGVTGVRQNISTDIGDLITKVKAEKEIPCAVGFGISTPEQAQAIAAVADGVIIGSAIVKIIAEYGENALEPVKAYAASIKQAISG